MPERTLKQVDFCLEYALAGDSEEHDPYQKAIDLPITLPLIIESQDDLTNIANELVLGLQKVNKNYVLFVVKDKLPLNSDVDKIILGAIKVGFTIAEAGRAEPYQDTTYYPFRKPKARQKINMSGSIKWHLLLKQDANNQYSLIFVDDQGATAADKCERLKCATTTDEATRQLCTRKGCYS